MMLLEIVVCSAASYLFGQTLFSHVPKLARMLYHGMTDDNRAALAATAPLDIVDDWEAIRREGDAAWEKHEARLFADTGAWWLDPNRWGEAPPPKPSSKRSSATKFDRNQAYGRNALAQSLARQDAQNAYGQHMTDAQSLLNRNYRDASDYANAHGRDINSILSLLGMGPSK